MNRNLKIADSMLDLIGGIPLVRLNRIGEEVEVEFWLNRSTSIRAEALRTVSTCAWLKRRRYGES